MVKILIIISFVLMTGCTDAYYQNKTAYYNAQAAAIAAHKPLTRVLLENGTIIETANPNDIKTIQPARNPVVDILSTVLNSTPAAILSGGWAAGRVIDAATGDNNSISTVDNHSAVSEPTVITQPAPTIVPAAEPVIVTQPEPIIVKPEIVITTGDTDGY